MTTMILENRFLSFSIDPSSGEWSVRSRDWDDARIENAQCAIRYRLAHSASVKETILRDAEPSSPARMDSIHGPLQSLALKMQDVNGVMLKFEFATPLERPFLLWRVRAENKSPTGLRLRELELLAAGPRNEHRASLVRLHRAPGELAFFTNGWQSWSYTGALASRDRHPQTRLGPLTMPRSHSPGTPYPFRRGHFISHMFGMLGDCTHRRGLLIGFLSQLEQFGYVQAVVDSAQTLFFLRASGDDVVIAPNDSIETDWAVLQFIRLDDSDPLETYVIAAGKEAGARMRAVEETPVGWCSWYYFFDRVTEKNLLDNLRAVKENHDAVPLSFFQLDDGFETAVGDWFPWNEKFPHKPQWLTEQIRKSGLKPGLWLAPFCAQPKAKIAQEHPDWILRRENGKPATAGFVNNAWWYALDLTHPQVESHIQNLIRTAVKDWGFSYLKLDFLYAGALKGQPQNPRVTRAQALRRAFELIREAAGTETFLVGCGCPLGPGIGIFDGMRVSTDVDPHWLANYKGITLFFSAEPDLPSTRSAIRNTITRAPLHRRWWLNDPDCLLVRDANTSLNLDEVQSLASVIALSGGMFLLSDDLASLARERRRMMEPLLPVTGRSARGGLDGFTHSVEIDSANVGCGRRVVCDRAVQLGGPSALSAIIAERVGIGRKSPVACC